MSRDDDRPRDDNGAYVEEVIPESALEVFTDHEPRTAREVAEELGVVRRTAYNKLDELKEQGKLRKKKVGSRAVVWWLPE